MTKNDYCYYCIITIARPEVVVSFTYYGNVPQRGERKNKTKEKEERKMIEVCPHSMVTRTRLGTQPKRGKIILRIMHGWMSADRALVSHSLPDLKVISNFSCA